MTRDKLIKKIATWIMMAIMLSVFLLDIICVAMCNRYQNKFEITPARSSTPARETAIRAGSSATTAAKRLL